MRPDGLRGWTACLECPPDRPRFAVRPDSGKADWCRHQFFSQVGCARSEREADQLAPPIPTPVDPLFRWARRLSRGRPLCWHRSRQHPFLGSPVGALTPCRIERFRSDVRSVGPAQRPGFEEEPLKIRRAPQRFEHRSVEPLAKVNHFRSAVTEHQMDPMTAPVIGCDDRRNDRGVGPSSREARFAQALPPSSFSSSSIRVRSHEESPTAESDDAPSSNGSTLRPICRQDRRLLAALGAQRGSEAGHVLGGTFG